MTAIIHVNRQFIAVNAKDGRNRPVYTIKPNGPNSTPIYCRGFSAANLVGKYDTKGLKCGAKAWLETDDPITYEDPMTWEEAALCK